MQRANGEYIMFEEDEYYNRQIFYRLQGTPQIGNVTATLSAAPSSISTGQPVTLSWTSSNATSMSIDHGIGEVEGRSVQIGEIAGDAPVVADNLLDIGMDGGVGHGCLIR